MCLLVLLCCSMDNNKANQCNPNNPLSGSGRNAGFQGDNYKAARDNHSQQLNPNNPKFIAPKK